MAAQSWTPEYAESVDCRYCEHNAVERCECQPCQWIRGQWGEDFHRRVESDTSSNARPDTADDGTNWPESAR